MQAEGLTIRAAAIEEGKHHSTLRRYVVAGEEDRVRQKLRDWRDDNREHVNKWARERAREL